MNDEPIPLYDGEPLATEIIHHVCTPGGVSSQGVRPKRTKARTPTEKVHICFSPLLPEGHVDHVECPVVDMATDGIGVEYDRELKAGVTGHVAYRTVGRDSVRVSCHVGRCVPMDNGHFLIGLKLDRELRPEERKPAKVGAGREIAAGIRPRKLSDATTPVEAQSP